MAITVWLENIFLYLEKDKGTLSAIRPATST
jgi:hypothetical protein